MTIADRIYAIAKTMPPEQAQEILNFTEFLRAKYPSDRSSSERDSAVNWQEIVFSLSGSWGDDFPSLEEIRTNSTDAERLTFKQDKTAAEIKLLKLSENN
jgi:hypothetical protein